MFSRVAVAALLLLFRCEESSQIGIPSVVQDVGQVNPTTDAVISGVDSDGNTELFHQHTPPPPVTTLATTTEDPSVPRPPTPPIPPLDFDMNAIAQISSFPFARSAESSDPFHMLITAQYAAREDEVARQKCTMTKGTGESNDGLDTRMGTAKIGLDSVTRAGDLFAPGLSIVSGFYRNQEAAKAVRQVTEGCSSGNLRHHMVIVEPAFPSRLYCESCQSSKNQYPAEFYHLQGYNKPTKPNLAALTPASFNQLYAEDSPLPADSILPLGAWADPQYSFIQRLEAWKNIMTNPKLTSEDKHKQFVSEHPLRLSFIDRFLLTGVPSPDRNLLTGLSPDGAVRILSSPLPTGNARPRHLTLACAQVQSSSAVASDSITHVEFISTDVKEKEHEMQHQPEYAVGSPEKWENDHDLSGATNFPGGYKFDDWEVYNETKFKSKAATSSDFNLRLFVHFSPFSCCSSCCCSREQCGKKLATGQKNCYDLVSTKSRIGHLVVQKADKSKSVTIKDTIAEGLKEFNALLSQEPFATTGLSIYSQRFRHPNWTTIQTKLLDPTAGFGKVIGLSHTPRFIDTVKCVDKEKDCDNLAECRGFVIPKVPVSPDEEDPDNPDVPSTKCVPASIKGLKEVKLEAETNNIKLKEGDAVRIVPTSLKESEVRWTVGSEAVEMMDETKPCDQQNNVFVDTNGRDLIIQSVTPQIADSPIEAKTATASAKITVDVERKSWWKDNKIYFILAIVLVVLVIVGVCAFCCWWKCFRGKGYCKRGKSSRTENGSTKKSTKRTGKSSKKDSKEGEECNSTSDKELTQNPGSSARPAWRVEQKDTKEEKKKDSGELTKKVTARLSAMAPAPAGDDFFTTPGERQKADANAPPMPGAPGQKDANVVVTDQEHASAVKSDDGLKTERLSGPIGNQVFGIPSIPAPGEAAAVAPAASPDHPAAAAAVVVPAVGTSKESEKDEEKSSSKSSTKSDRKGDVKSPEKKGDKKDKKKDGKKDSKKKDGKKDKKKSDKKDSSKKKTTKKSPKDKSPKKKVSAKPKKSAKKPVSHKKKK